MRFAKKPEIRNVIYLQPIGQFRQDQSPSLEIEELVVYGELEDRLIEANLLR
jgi:hypothetical protein